MYTFKDKGDRSITLRPEEQLQLCVHILNIKCKVIQTNQLNFITMDRCLEYERKQKGRYRQFNQFGVEAIGAENLA